MNVEIGGIGRPGPDTPRQRPANRQRAGPDRTGNTVPRDRVDIGRNGVSMQQAVAVVTERSMEQLREVMNETRDAVGAAVDLLVDTTPGAAPSRIMEFALGEVERFRGLTRRK